MTKNKTGRDFVCGDIHGCFSDLNYLLKKNNFDTSKDRLFCVGDLIDRGPSSSDALFYFREKWLWSVLGNHEQMLYETFIAFGADFAKVDYKNGSDWARKQSTVYLSALAREIKKLPLMIRLEDSVIVHAALPDVASFEVLEKTIADHLETILWYRGKTISIRIPGVNRVYCGHTIIEDVQEDNGVVNLDTGCILRHFGETGHLTMLEIS